MQARQRKQRKPAQFNVIRDRVSSIVAETRSHRGLIVRLDRRNDRRAASSGARDGRRGRRRTNQPQRFDAPRADHHGRVGQRGLERRGRLDAPQEPERERGRLTDVRFGVLQGGFQNARALRHPNATHGDRRAQANAGIGIQCELLEVGSRGGRDPLRTRPRSHRGRWHDVRIPKGALLLQSEDPAHLAIGTHDYRRRNNDNGQRRRHRLTADASGCGCQRDHHQGRCWTDSLNAHNGMVARVFRRRDRCRAAVILRGPLDFRYLAIEGPPALGKTTLAERLGAALDATVVLEDGDNPFLADCQAGRPGAAFQAQLFFTLARHRQLLSLRQRDLFSQATVCDYVFERDRVYAFMNLDDNELFIYQRLFDLVARDLVQPDLVIYLQTPTERLERLVRDRTRVPESETILPPVDDLAELNEAYNHFFFHYSATPLLVVETSQVDLTWGNEAVDDLLRQIKTMGRGTQYYVPRR
jgi:deoxyguanosine kinase